MMRAKKAWIAVLSLGLALLPALAWAQPVAKQKAVTAKEMDANGDGKVGQEEFLKPWTDKQAGQEAFKRLDGNADGHITSADLMGNFQGLDQDKDGKVSLGEWSASWHDKAAAKDAFQRLDVNGDGYLTPDEYLGMWPGIPFLTW